MRLLGDCWFCFGRFFGGIFFGKDTFSFIRNKGDKKRKEEGQNRADADGKAIPREGVLIDRALDQHCRDDCHDQNAKGEEGAKDFGDQNRLFGEKTDGKPNEIEAADSTCC